MYKYIAKNVAHRNGKVVTFMPKPLFEDNGSGMHVHFSLWKEGKPLFAGNRYAGMSEMGLHAIGGILKHARALCALCNPTTNSYKRLVPGYEVAGEPRLQQPQPIRRHSHSDVQRKSEDQTPGIPLAGQQL
ncbi:MAG: hypothetical protein QM754_09025 [Tepidisphaeraceae bacterium]